MNTHRPLAAMALAAAAIFSAPAAQAAAPVASGLPAGFSFAQYTGSAPVGVGAVDTDSTLFFIDEKTVGSFKSWFIFFDPNAVQPISGTLTFDAPIVSIDSTRAAIDASTPTYGSAGITYGSRQLNGLEPVDSLSFAGNVLTIDWITADPGDHIRVLTTAVPEPESYALFGAGLLALAFVSRRRLGR